eukprot:2553068-Pyramimonas_sp.AAC.1
MTEALDMTKDLEGGQGIAFKSNGIKLFYRVLKANASAAWALIQNRAPPIPTVWEISPLPQNIEGTGLCQALKDQIGWETESIRVKKKGKGAKPKPRCIARAKVPPSVRDISTGGTQAIINLQEAPPPKAKATAP